MIKPSLRLERALHRDGHVLVAGVDEVGRGALAGPVTIGVVVVDANVRSAPIGLRDSKLLTPAAREALDPAVRRWAVSWAIGHAQPGEIDQYGIIAALRLAAARAFAALPHRPDVAILDGNHNYLRPPARQEVLFETPEDEPADPVLEQGLAAYLPALVVTRIKADQSCSSVAGASVLAKCRRDALMVARHPDHPQFNWLENKGYAAPEHMAALAQHGPCDLHRRSWRLPQPGSQRPEQAGGGMDVYLRAADLPGCGPAGGAGDQDCGSDETGLTAPDLIPAGGTSGRAVQLSTT